ncbi:MAG: sigma-70 family RNA polymerase sigma factor [Planctomycetota bacterium]
MNARPEETRPDESRSEEAVDSTASVDREAELLLARVAKGDADAFAKLVDRETPRLLRRVARRLPGKLRPRVGASDIVQHTAVEVISLRERFDDRGLAAFRSFVNTIADFNVARVIERESAKKRNVDREQRSAGEYAGVSRLRGGVEDLAAEATSPSHHAQRKETSDLVHACFEELSLSDQLVIVLIDYDEVGYTEAARLLGVSEDSARARHSRAVRRLRERLRLRRGDDATGI